MRHKRRARGHSAHPALVYRFTNSLPGQSWSVLIAAAAAATATTAAALLAEAIGAVYWLIATWYKGHLGLLAAAGAYYVGHRALGAAITAATAAAISTAIAATIAVAVVTTATTTAAALRALRLAAIIAANWLAEALLIIKILLTFSKGERVTAIAAR